MGLPPCDDLGRFASREFRQRNALAKNGIGEILRSYLLPHDRTKALHGVRTRGEHRDCTHLREEVVILLVEVLRRLRQEHHHLALRPSLPQELTQRTVLVREYLAGLVDHQQVLKVSVPTTV